MDRKRWKVVDWKWIRIKWKRIDEDDWKDEYEAESEIEQKGRVEHDY